MRTINSHGTYMIYDVPGMEKLTLNTIILDLNGTLSVGGRLVDGVHGRINKLKEMGFKIVFFTGNTRRDAHILGEQLGIEWRETPTSSAKLAAAEEFEPLTTVSIGNGLIDLELMTICKLRIVTLQGEGVHVKTLMQSDIVVTSIVDALDILIDKDKLIATLRS